MTNRLVHLAGNGLTVPAAFVVTLLVVYVAWAPAVVTTDLWGFTIVDASLALAFTGAGLAIAVLVGGLDLSCAGVIALTNATVTVLYGAGPAQQILSVLAAIAIGVAAGIVNGSLVHYFGLEPVVVTLATGFVLSGCALLVLPTPRGVTDVDGFSVLDFISSSVLGVPIGLLLLVALVLSWLVFRRSRWGSRLMAVGSDADAAANSGVPVGPTRILGFAIAGGLYGTAGVVLTSQISGGDTQLGAGYLLAAFAAVVIGGVRLGGGQGSVIGAVLGAVAVTVMVNVVFILGLATYWSTIARGLILVAALLVQALLVVIARRTQSHSTFVLGGVQ